MRTKPKLPGRLAGMALILAATWALPWSPPVRAERPVEPGVDRFNVVGAVARFAMVLALVDPNGAPAVNRQRWNELIDERRAAVCETTTHADFARELNALIAATGVSHFHYYTEDDFEYWHLRSAFAPGDPAGHVEHVGIYPQNIDGRWFVRGVLEGSIAEHSDVRVGDELVCVDGRPFQPVASFRGRAGQPVVLTLRRHKDVTHTVKLTPVRESLFEVIQAAMLKSVGVIEHDGRRFATLHGWTMLGGGAEYQALADLQPQVDGLLLDYRDGVGGRTFHAWAFLLSGQGAQHADPKARFWYKPVVILTADGTRSAKEIVVDAVKTQKRGPLVGTPTPGHVVGVAAIPAVGEDALLMLPGYAFPLEGHPTLPDYLVERDIRYCGGDDPQMEVAKKVLAALALKEQGADPPPAR